MISKGLIACHRGKGDTTAEQQKAAASKQNAISTSRGHDVSNWINDMIVHTESKYMLICISVAKSITENRIKVNYNKITYK